MKLRSGSLAACRRTVRDVSPGPLGAGLRRLRFEPLEDRRLLSVTLERPGAAVSGWDPQYADHSLNSQFDGGVVLGVGWFPFLSDYSKPTYQFHLPDRYLGNGLSSLTVRAYGESGLVDGTELFIGGVNEGYVESGTAWTTHTFAGAAARSRLVDAGDGVGSYLNVTLESLNFNDWYDLREIEVQYSYPGISDDSLSAFQEAYSGHLALADYGQFVNTYWSASQHSHHALYKATQRTIAFANNLRGIASDSLFSAARAAAKSLESFQNLASGISEGFDYFQYWLSYGSPLGAPSRETLRGQLNSAATELKQLAQEWSARIDDGVISDPEKLAINGRIDDAVAGLNTLISSVNSAAGRMHSIYRTRNVEPGDGNGDATAELMLRSLAPMVVYDYHGNSLVEQSSYLVSVAEEVNSRCREKVVYRIAAFGCYGVLKT